MEKTTTVNVAATCAHIAADRKANDVTVLNITGLCSFADYFVIATGRNARQLKAIASAISQMAGHNGLTRIGTEGAGGDTWILIDLGDVVVHLFSPEMRGLYDLELLWGDAGRVEWQDLAPLPVPEGAARDVG
jgi:ribosome-associated protein